MSSGRRGLPFVVGALLMSFLGGCAHAMTNSGRGPDGDRQAPAYTGAVDALFVGHSAMNNVVDDYVLTLASTYDSENRMRTVQVTSGPISLNGKAHLDALDPVFRQDTHDFEIAVLTEQWGHQEFYDPAEFGQDTYGPVFGCPPADHAYPEQWVTMPWLEPEGPRGPLDWSPTPYWLQRYADAIACGNPSATSFYYQSWSVDYNESVPNATTRRSDPDYVRQTIAAVDPTLGREGDGAVPDMGLADFIEYQGVKWERFVAAANRPNLVFIPTNYALAQLMRDIEAGTAPGFEALRDTNGLTAAGELGWVDWIFYEDGYHLSTVGHYFMSLVIFSAVYNVSPEGLEVGSGNYAVSDAFRSNQYPPRGDIERAVPGVARCIRSIRHIRLEGLPRSGLHPR